ncbi:D-aspartate oxidase isoform X1 [Patella vulgata]|uniref:D-aspartate oxidase isoform X1 n=2 Tax=Patella vulgata TaxID=6465 RepID=UPI002180706B|nr:D-aspartate oxidase isoform X1 [Patella vulgata]XP_050395749.1 D-aspartate oxidase isoform X1 [Patella vulgata]XP_050395750.1 D-aspartate oxidase isoform X1 [Patella vulgata]
MVKIAVIGAGVVGLSTAINIQELIPTATVTLFADKFEKDTTSWGAGGLFRPTFHHIKGDKELIRRWVEASWNFYSAKALSSESKEIGAFVIDGYSFSSKKEADPLIESVAFHVRLLSDKEKECRGFRYPYVHLISTISISPGQLLPYLMRRFQQQGGTSYFRTVASLEEFVGKFDIVVNCTALACRQLIGDESIFPVRGQLRRVRAPWIKHWYLTEDDTYLIPQANGEVTLGGCRQKGNYHLEVDKQFSEDISKRCEQLVPGVTSAEVIFDWVGLRPTREPIRVEKELMDFNGNKLRVVHNYGHGANGISLSWGTAVDAAELVKDWTRQMSFTSRL